MILDKELYSPFNFLKGTFLLFKKIGLGLTARWFSPSLVEKYNNELKGERYRGLPELTSDDSGNLLCTSCMVCVEVCPSECIHISPTEFGEAPNAFYIEPLRCTFCGLCEEFCPDDALIMGKKESLAGHAEQEWVKDHFALAPLKEVKQTESQKSQ